MPDPVTILDHTERAAAEHLAWLKQVHTALLFGEGDAPAVPPLPDCLAVWAEAPALAAEHRADTVDRLQRAHQRMVLHAGALRQDAGAEAYQAFMASVEAYAAALRGLQAELRQALLETDPLTGVFNRHGMMRDLEREWQRAQRTNQPCCVAIADLDHFKAVNDRHGHPAGDRVLAVAAQFFTRRLRPYDRVYRYGGEEFLFCLPDTEVDQAAQVLNRLRLLLARLPIRLESGTILRVTTSIGVAEMADETRPPAEAIAAADRAVYAAKRAGRNRVRLAGGDGFDAVALERLGLGTLMRDRPLHQ